MAELSAAILLLVVGSLIQFSTGIIMATPTGALVTGDLQVTGSISQNSSQTCCLSGSPISSLIGDGSLQPVLTLQFELDPYYNGTSAGTLLGPVPMFTAGTPPPAVAVGAGRDGKGCMNFTLSGTGYIYSRGVPLGLPLGDAGHTFSVWVKTSSAGASSGHGILFCYGYGAARNFNVLRFNGCNQIGHFFYSYDWTWTGLPNLCSNTWMHIAFVWDAITLTRTLYVNGTSYGSQVPGTVQIQIIPGHLFVGANFGNGAERYWGLMDDWRFYNEALNASQITTLYNS